MKIKLASFIQSILCILTILFIPVMASSAQSDDQAPDFLITLALMAVADDRMDGVMDTADLANLRALVDEYYSNKSIYQMTPETSQTLNQQRTSLLNALDKKIEDQRYSVNRAQTTLLFSLSRIGDDQYVRDENDPNILNVDEQALNDRIMGILADGPKPDQNLTDLLNQRLNQDAQGNLEKDLDGHVANSIVGGDQLVAQTSDTTYDFSAGISKEAYLEQLSQTKPLVFINNGARDVTVSIEYYAPFKGVAFSAPGLNLTVSKENRVATTGFPQGNYVFCADWETDLDTNGDGIKDYDRMVTHIWLSSAAPDDPNTAEPVYVNSVGTSTPTGRCDGFMGEAPQTEKLMTEIFMTEDDDQISGVLPQEEADPGGDADFWDQDPDEEEAILPTEEDDLGEGEATETPVLNDSFTLSAAELANQGSHNYQITCERSWGFTDTNSVSANWEFTAGGVTNLGEGSSYVKIAENIYQNDFPTTITFTTSGYQVLSYVYETDSDGTTTTYTTQCTAIFE
jgi:hypothetical protein